MSNRKYAPGNLPARSLTIFASSRVAMAGSSWNKFNWRFWPQEDTMSRRSQRGNAQYALARAAACAIIGTVSASTFAHDREAKRLAQIREMVAAEPKAVLVTTSGVGANADRPFCETLLGDLKKRRNFRPLEPVAILDHSYPVRDPDRPIDQDPATLSPALKTRSERDRRLLGPALSNAITSCAAAEADGDEKRAARLFNGLDSRVGAPPYRIYSIAPGLNPFPEARLVYWSEYIQGRGPGREGYSWVNLEKCEHAGGIPARTDALSLDQDPAGQQAALTVRHDRSVVGWTAWKGHGYGAYVIKV